MSISFNMTDWEQNNAYLKEYISKLSYPMDSYLEENLEKSEVFSIDIDEVHAGFAARQGETLWSFYIGRPWFKLAQTAFEQFVKEQRVREVFFQTSDTVLISLICDWEFEKRKSAYFFIDAGRIEKPQVASAAATFRTAAQEDIEIIRQHTGDFFDNLEQLVSREMIFMLTDNDELLGCGIIEYGKFFKDCASIGMITSKAHRNKGVGRVILWNLKELCYSKGLKPIAGCWYYNTLSRKTLERAGMVSIARGMTACLTGKETIPERTGNPPGEDI